MDVGDDCCWSSTKLFILSLFWQHRCFIVATCDKDLKRRIRKVGLTNASWSHGIWNRNGWWGPMAVSLRHHQWQIPGVPIMYVSNRKYTIERMPEAFGGE